MRWCRSTPPNLPGTAAPRKPRTTALPMLLAALAGAASVFSFAPFGWWPVAILSLAFLFYQVGMDTNVKRSTLIGWAFARALRRRADAAAETVTA